MSLPKIVTPEYTVQLKSIKAPVRFRPYLVKEEKVFLTAKESDDPTEINSAVRLILRNCTFDAIDIDKLPSFDIEYLFLQLRAKSVNNIVNLSYRCENPIDKSNPEVPVRCHQINTVAINLDEIRIDTPEGHTNVVRVSDELTIEFKYPTMESMGDLLSSKRDLVLAGPIIAASIKSVTNNDGTVYEAQDYTKDEWLEFVDAMPLQYLEKCADFFKTMPKLKHEVTFKCVKCGYEEPITFEGIADFFD